MNNECLENFFEKVNDSTGFANGEKFENEKQVRDYFTVENIIAMFGRDRNDYDEDCEILNQDLLDEWADKIIYYKLHCCF